MMFHPGADIIKGILLPVRKRELFFTTILDRRLIDRRVLTY